QPTESRTHMSDDRRTKAQLASEVERLERQVSELQASIPPAPTRVPEAEALAACIRALDKLKDASRGTSYSGYNDGPKPEVARTLLALSEKYGINRVEKVTEPCTRRHVEDMSAMDVLAAVKRDFEGMSFP